MSSKKSIIFLICTIFLISLVTAQNYKLGISTIPEDKIFDVGSNIQIKVTLYDESNNPVNDDIKITLKDLKGEVILEKTIKSNIGFEQIALNQNILSGEGKIIAEYKDVQVTESFFISENEKVKFEIQNGKLIITNIGNSLYQRRVYITIGDTTGIKTPNLNLEESISYRLIAPEGVYNIKVTDGETTLTKGDVQLTGTGNIIGALDESAGQRSSITGTLSPEKESEGELVNYFRNNSFVYIFVLVVFGAVILLAVERRYRKKVYGWLIYKIL